LGFISMTSLSRPAAAAEAGGKQDLVLIFIAGVSSIEETKDSRS
jgi:hypothetical protein